MVNLRRTLVALILPPVLSMLVLQLVFLMLLAGHGVAQSSAWPPNPRLSTAVSDTVVILVDDYEPQPLQGKSFWPHNRLGGNRDIINITEGRVVWGRGRVTATITATSSSEVGVWTALNHPLADHESIDFSAIFPPQIKSEYQGQITGLQIDIITGTGTFRVELKAFEPTAPFSEVIQWQRSVPLSNTPVTLHFDVTEPLTEIQNLNWLVSGAPNSFVMLDRIAFTATMPHLPPAERAFLWSYAMFLNNWDDDSGLTRDHAYYAAERFDNVSASGMQAAAAVMAVRLGFITPASATQIVDKTTEGLLAIQRCKGLWPHFVETRTHIVSGTEWSSIDTTLAVIALIEARESLGLAMTPTLSIQNVITNMYLPTSTLILTDNTISHGYTSTLGNGACDHRIEGGWKDFGTESWLVDFGYRAVTGQKTDFDDTPPTFNGSGFIDELAWLLMPPPAHTGTWTIDWQTYRQMAADCQVNYYRAPAQNCLFSRTIPYYQTSGLFGLSAAEIPDHSAISATQIYTTFGVGGKIALIDGVTTLGYPVIVPHEVGLLAVLRPIDSIRVWRWLEDKRLFTPLNNVESFACKDATASTCTQLVWNDLKGSWNLSLQTLGWGRLLTGCDNPLYDGMRANALLGQDYPVAYYCELFLPIVFK